MAYSPEELREMSEHLLDIARRIDKEGEPLTLDDSFTLEEMVQLKSFLSSTRQAIDMVNKGLAMHWDEHHHGEQYDMEFNSWYVGTRKGKVILDDDTFYKWLATKTPVELSKLVSASSIKVGGMSPAERDTHLDETPRSTDVAIQTSQRR